MRHWLLIAFCSFFFVALYACEQDEEILYDEPNIRMTFYNQDSLMDVNDILADVNAVLVFTKDSLKYYSDSASVLQDSINDLEVLIQDGNDEYVPTLEDVEVLYSDVLNKYNQIFTLDSTMKVSRTQWNSVAATINSGMVLVSSITNNRNGRSIEYEDSATLWRLPLSNSEDDISVAIVIGEATYNLQMSYQRQTIVNEFDNVVIQAYNLDTISHGFDSLKINCATPECIDYETTLDIYF